GSNLRELILEVVGSPLPKASSISPGLPEQLDVVIERATAKEAQHRYQSARELSDDLQNLLDVMENKAGRIAAESLTGLTQSWRSVWLWAGAAGAAIICLILLGAIASNALDLGLGRTGGFKTESP